MCFTMGNASQEEIPVQTIPDVLLMGIVKNLSGIAEGLDHVLRVLLYVPKSGILYVDATGSLTRMNVRQPLMGSMLTIKENARQARKAARIIMVAHRTPFVKNRQGIVMDRGHVFANPICVRIYGNLSADAMARPIQMSAKPLLRESASTI